VLDGAARQSAEDDEGDRQGGGRRPRPQGAAADRREAAAVGRHQVRVHEKAAQVQGERGADVGGRGEKRQREAAEHEQGVDLGAFGDVAALDRLLELSLGRLFGLVVLLGRFSH
jgi:hypothetical protein